MNINLAKIIGIVWGSVAAGHLFGLHGLFAWWAVCLVFGGR